VWREYLWDAFARVNDANARKIVLYLAAHEPEERGRDQILADLKLDMSDQDLEERLHKLVMADILAEGSSNSTTAAWATGSSPWSSAGSTEWRSSG